ncbi:unnamed protein product [Rhodiola kirilowii]
MVSSFCQSSASLHRLGFQLNSNHFHPLGFKFPFSTTQITPNKHHSFTSVRSGTGRVGIRSEYGQKKPRTLFPGGYKRPEIKVPNLVLEVSSEEVLSGGGDVLDKVDLAVSKCVGIVVLNGGEGSGGGKLYEAAVLLKSVVRDRAALMILDRVDIATAVNANGVVLSDQGLPTIVARSAMMDAKVETVMLPMVAKKVQTAKAAMSASNSEGADFLLLDPVEDENPKDFVSSLLQNIKVPIFVTWSLNGLGDGLFGSGASGFVVSLKHLRQFSEGDMSHLVSASPRTNSKSLNDIEDAKFIEVQQSNNGSYRKDRAVGIVNAEVGEKKFIEMEKQVLLEAIDVITKAAPMMEEVTLLTDAVAQLDELFLLVIVGEFNSGKSSVINALLGNRYMKEGVVPTTNEITFLKYSELDSGEQQRCERHPDGQYICYLPATILKELNIVDTPGTNVILQRQQRLTEEFVPRADLLLFVISADRPLTESEVTFLRYIQQWRKRVVFVLNKSDLYQNATELEEAISFIKENTQKLLNTDQVTLYPVSARSALKTKLAASCGIVDPEMNNSNSRINRFDDLENFLYSFLDGTSSMGIERMKLKLETPVAIADRLFNSCSALSRQEWIYAKQDLASIDEFVNTVKDYAKTMEYEHNSWKRQIASLIETTKSRVINVILSTLKVSNVDLVASYAFKGDRIISTPAALRLQNDIIGPAHADAQRILGEYLSWLNSKSNRERSLINESFEKRWPEILSNAGPTESYKLLKAADEHSLSAIGEFSASAACKLFEQEVREVFLGTFGGLGAAGLSASLLTSVLPTSLEDLLALGLCSAGGYFAISSFSYRRRKLVDKVNRIAESLARELDNAMQKDLSKAITDMENFAAITSKPYQDAAQHRLDKALQTQEEISQVEKKLQALQMEIQNLHFS